MKSNLIKIYSTLFCILTSVMLFAEPGSGSNTGDLETPDTSAPIDNMLYVLVVLGMVLALYTIRKYRKNLI